MVDMSGYESPLAAPATTAAGSMRELPQDLEDLL